MVIQSVKREVRGTRQVVAWHHGSRSLLCCRQLWEKIPTFYKQGLIFTDFWKAYQEVVPDHQPRPPAQTTSTDHQHRPCAKQDGQTNHVERFNLTLPQRIARLTRKTLSFSKSHSMHLIHIRAFFLQYNLEQARKYQPACVT